MDSLQPPNQAGTLINNRYRIQQLLGRGGFGQTYLAYDTQCFNHPCVLKEFAPANRTEYTLQKARELFEREARVLYEIDHPQIPKFLAWFVDRGRLFLVQEYITGKTYAQLLRERQRQRGAFSETEVVQWLIDLLSVLQYLHQRQIVHRDISPDNMMLPDTRDARPILIDFGLVKQTLTQIQTQISGGRSEAVSFVGKFGYAPPEQIRMGQCFPSSDLYALGVTALVLLTGQEPRLLMDQESMEWYWQDYIQISPLLSQVLTRLLQEKPRDRYQSAAEVIKVLQPIALNSAQPRMTTVFPPPWQTAPTIAAPAQSESSPASLEPVSLDPNFLQSCQQELTRCIGPIADYVMENALSQYPCATASQLIEVLARDIPDPIQADGFRQRLSSLSPPTFPSQSTARSTTKSKIRKSSQPFTLSPDFLDRCNQALIRCIGPVATVILDDLLMHTPPQTPEELIEAIVAEIPNDRQAEAFRKLME